MTHLVVGLDGTAGDSAVLRWTAKFGAQWDARVTLVHTIPRTTLWLVSSVQADSDEYVERMRRSLLTEALSYLGSLTSAPTLHIGRGDPANELATVARDTAADLIVIGGPDHRALHDAVSSIARRLERCSDTPILIVPKAKVVAHG